MCGRLFIRYHDVAALLEELAEAWDAPSPDCGGNNIQPGRALVILPQGGAPHYKMARWGLIPPHTKPADASYFKMFNARDDNLLMIHARLLNAHRCVIPVSGFYEWQKQKGDKQPYLVYAQSGPGFFMAGLHDQWTNGEGVVESTFAIVTVDPAPNLTWLHDRAPCVLDAASAAKWLDGNAPWTAVRALVAPTRALKWHPVTKRLGKATYQEPDCSKEIDLRGGAKPITSYFSLKPKSAVATDDSAAAAAADSPSSTQDTKAEQDEALASPSKKKRRIDDYFKS